MVERITRQELEQTIEGGAVTIVETLRSEHFQQGHLPGAIHIHYESISELARELLPDTDAPIVTYCSDTACSNSEMAANRLVAMGYTNVRTYAEGKRDWEAAGLSLETSAAVAEEETR